MKVFVFGANRLGIHGAGAARVARQEHGAKHGIGEGHVGRSYAIPTKKTPRERLPLSEIAKHVTKFLEYARAHPELDFYVTRIGCGLAGYKESQIRPLFDGAPANCEFTWFEEPITRGT